MVESSPERQKFGRGAEGSEREPERVLHQKPLEDELDYPPEAVTPEQSAEAISKNDNQLLAEVFKSDNLTHLWDMEPLEAVHELTPLAPKLETEGGKRSLEVLMRALAGRKYYEQMPDKGTRLEAFISEILVEIYIHLNSKMRELEEVEENEPANT